MLEKLRNSTPGYVLTRCGASLLMLGIIDTAIGALTLPEDFVGFDNVDYTTLPQEEIKSLLRSKSFIDTGVALLASGTVFTGLGLVIAPSSKR